jgi:hypothetical protein
MKSGIEWLFNAHGRRARPVAAAYRDLLATAEGKLVLRDLAAYCRVGLSSFAAGDPHQTAFNEGARDVFLHVAEMAGLTSEDFTPLLAATHTTNGDVSD